MAISSKVTERLEEFKGYIQEAYDYWQPNNKRFNEFKTFVHSTTLSQSDISKLQMLQKPTLEFNTLEAFISRQCGEFDEHEPGLSTGLADGVLPSRVNPSTVQTIEVVQAHVADILYDAKQKGLQNQLYKDSMSGGFAAAKVGTKYINERSFEQCIYFDRVFDPTLVGFDPLAREPHKGDGRYCFEIIPKTKEEFENEYGKEKTKNMKFTRNIQSFAWSFSNAKQKIVLIAELWLKKRKREKIMKLSNGHVILAKHYPELKELWNNVERRVEQCPIPIEDRWTITEQIDLYRLCENEVLSHTPTDYSYLPLVYFDGNSEMLKKNINGSAQQMTKPYVYQAKGVQKLKNFAGQTIASEIESMVENRWIAAKEGIPEDYLDAYKNPQKAQAMVYNAFYKGNPANLIPPPREVVRSPMPDIVQQTFMGTDQVTQTILGSYDAQMGIVKGGPISGDAIESGAMQTSAAAKPYLTNYIIGLNRVGEIILDLIPKYYVTPRSIPIRKPNGTRDFQIINDDNNPNSIRLNYRPKDLQIKVEAGVNSKLEKRLANEAIVSVMNVSETFAEFINNEAMPVLIQNLNIKGSTLLLEKAEEFMAKRKQALEASAGQPSPEEKMIQAQVDIENNKTEQRREQAQGELAIKASQVAIDKEKADIEFFRLMAEIEQADYKQMREVQQFDSDLALAAIESALEVSQHHFDIEQAQAAQMMQQASEPLPGE